MPKDMIIRKVPDELHRQLKSEAALKGVSLQDLILSLLKKHSDKAAV